MVNKIFRQRFRSFLHQLLTQFLLPSYLYLTHSQFLVILVFIWNIISFLCFPAYLSRWRIREGWSSRWWSSRGRRGTCPVQLASFYIVTAILAILLNWPLWLVIHNHLNLIINSLTFHWTSQSQYENRNFRFLLLDLVL